MGYRGFKSIIQMVKYNNIIKKEQRVDDIYNRILVILVG